MSFSSLSLREKAIIFIALLFVIGVFAYMFGIRTLNEAHAEMIVELDSLNQQKNRLDKLKEENVVTENNINELKANITKVEQSFIAEIKSENLEQFVLKTFEENGIPFLAKVEMEDVTTYDVKTASGAVADENLLCKRVNVEYASTDGYEATQYNITPEMNKADGSLDMAVINAMINSTGKFDETRYLGYEEFLNALKAIEKADPDCIKISFMSIKSTHGYLTMKASIDFYSANLANRISKENRTTGFAVWKGETGVDTEGGFIGMPYKVNNPHSRWNGVIIDKKEITGLLERPFASYVSNAKFTQLINQKGIEAIVGGGIQAADTTNVPVTQDDQEA